MPGESTLPPDLEAQLDRAVVDYLRAEAAGQTPDRELLLERHPHIRTELGRFFADQDAIARVAAPLREVGSVAGATPRDPLVLRLLPPPRTLPAHFGAYELLEEIGRGGMGVVYRAHHQTLQRIVALKLIAPGTCGDADARARFVNEARAAARIQHPNVVQIFEVGEHDGQPYLALEYVAGGSLAQYLRGQPLPGPQAASLVVTLARALEAAHQGGVVHRDLKPGNVLLPGWTPQAAGSAEDPGRALASPKITDFGLARLLDGETSSQTETGAIVGTPSYMAPEQAEGRARQAGPGADVYALGAVLYELLTGRPPFRGVTRLDTLHQVMRDEPVPPRRLLPATPRDLDTICLKCLHKEPGKRYATAQELAEELRRFQAGRPIHARPVGRIEIAWRWCRRQPVLAALLAALVLAITLGAALVVWQWRRAERHYRDVLASKAEADASRIRAEKSRTESEDSFHLAHAAVKDFLSQMVQQRLLETPGVEPFRQELLKKAQVYYEHFLKRRGQDPGLRQELADTSVLLADLIRQTGKPAEALAAYRRALDLYEALPHEGAAGVELRLQEAVLYSQRASIFGGLERLTEAQAAVDEAQRRLKEALQAQPGDRRLRRELASTYHNTAMIHESAHRIEEARTAFSRARVLFEKLLTEQPDDADFQAKLANTLNSLGAMLLRNGHEAEALVPLRRAANLYQRLAVRFPKNLSWRSAWANSLYNLADCLRARGRLPRSLTQLMKARTVLQQVVLASPHVVHYRFQLGLLYGNLSGAQKAAGDLGSALESLDRARNIFHQLTEEQPHVADYQVRLGLALFDIADIQTRQGKLDLAEKTFQQGRDVQARLVKSYPKNPQLAGQLGLTLYSRGWVLARLGRPADAHQSVQEATEQYRRALAVQAQDARWRGGLADSYVLLAELCCDLGRMDDAAATMEKRLPLEVGNPRDLYDVARALIGASVKSTPAVRCRCLDTALRSLRQALKQGYRDPKRIRTDPALDSVRKEEPFQKLLTEMSKETGP